MVSVCHKMEGRKDLVVVVVGASMCGKTKLIQRFAKNTFQQVSLGVKSIDFLFKLTIFLCFRIMSRLGLINCLSHKIWAANLGTSQFGIPQVN